MQFVLTSNISIFRHYNTLTVLLTQQVCLTFVLKNTVTILSLLNCISTKERAFPDFLVPC